MTKSAQTPKAPPTRKHQRKRGFLHEHSLGIASVCILLLWVCFYILSNPSTHWGSFFGNAIADWSGVVVTVIATKYLYEKGSAESKPLPKHALTPVLKWFRDHSLTVFLSVTGAGWVVLFARMDPDAKWGQVVGNIVSEWTQIFGLVLLTKRMIETHSNESRG